MLHPSNKNLQKAMRLYREGKLSFTLYYQLIGDLLAGRRRNHLRSGESLSVWNYSIN